MLFVRIKNCKISVIIHVFYSFFVVFNLQPYRIISMQIFLKKNRFTYSLVYMFRTTPISQKKGELRNFKCSLMLRQTNSYTKVIWISNVKQYSIATKRFENYVFYFLSLFSRPLLELSRPLLKNNPTFVYALRQSTYF